MRDGSSLITKAIFVMSFVVVLYLIKPTFMFKNNGKTREWGVGLDENGHKKTLLDTRWAMVIFCILFVKYYPKINRPRIIYY